MSRTDHNAPCPCGSGKKYKRCCLQKGPASTREGESLSSTFSEEERASAIQKLLSFVAGPEFKTDLEMAMAIFCGGCLADRSDEEVKEILHLPQTEINFNTWYLYDMDVEDGKTMVDFFLAGESARLSTGELNYLKKAMRSSYRLYEVEEVVLDSGFQLRDLWTGESFSVKELAATHSFVQWDLMATRLMELEKGYWMIDAGVFNYPHREKGFLMKELKHEYRRFQRNLPGQDETAFFKRIGFLFNHWWLHRVAFPSFPEVVTAEGDPVVFTRVIFDYEDRDKVTTALDASPEIERAEEGLYHWFEDTPESRRILGSLRLRKNRLVLETTSRERGERGRLLLEKTVGKSLRYRVSDYKTVNQAIKSPPKSRRHQAPEIPPDVQARISKEFLDRHYRQWLDEEIPALSHKTPRHAVKLKTYRPRVIDLLKELENLEAHAARRGKVQYDFGWLWKELGLERETQG